MAFTQNQRSSRARVIGGIVGVCALFAVIGGCAQESSATVSRSIDVQATPAAVWAAIGPFCSIRDWHPVVGTCEEDGNVPPTRTLVTADGEATFVEQQTERDDAEYTYSYTILSGPLPITNYVSTITVEQDGEGGSTIVWSSVYIPNDGAEEAAAEAVAGIYDAGLASIAAGFAE